MASYEALAGPRQARDLDQLGGDAVTGFLSVSLLIFAGCTALGMVPAAVLAARARQPAPAVITVLVAAFIICVLVSAAVRLSRS